MLSSALIPLVNQWVRVQRQEWAALFLTLLATQVWRRGATSSVSEGGSERASHWPSHAAQQGLKPSTMVCPRLGQLL